MREMVKVYNRGSKDYHEKQIDREFNIPKGGFIEMARREAIAFVGAIPPNEDNGQLREKNLEVIIEKKESAFPEPKRFISLLDGKEFKTQAELDAHLKKFEDKKYVNEEIEARLTEQGKTVNKLDVASKINCPYCGIELNGANSLAYHLQSKHKQIKEN